MNIDPILDRLERVKRIKPDTFAACCPAHADRKPSLEIKDAGDRALVICRAGCSFDEIRTALGMQAHEFFANGKASNTNISSFTALGDVGWRSSPESSTWGTIFSARR